MRMSRLEKGLVNRPEKGAANVRRIASQIERLRLPAGSRALEVGCGIGDVARHLAVDHGFEVVGTDSDPEQIELARQRHAGVPGFPRLSFAVADATQLRFPDAHFDLVVSQNVFHHVPAWPDAVEEIARVLRPGGHLFWLDLTTPVWTHPWLRPLGSQVGLYSQREIRDAFLAAGLAERDVRRLARGLRYEMTWRKLGRPDGGAGQGGAGEP
ncbi:MAG: class I SAM-dependent methyltransferase [Thermoanaerobaculia bacterium]